jgi:hypothetical protein
MTRPRNNRYLGITCAEMGCREPVIERYAGQYLCVHHLNPPYDGTPLPSAACSLSWSWRLSPATNRPALPVNDERSEG